MRLETVLMTFNEKSDEQIAYESLNYANKCTKDYLNGKTFSESDLREMMKSYLDAFWVYKEYNIKMAEDIATNIHTLGHIVLRKYGCCINYDEEEKSYYTKCPAILLHCDFGFSIRAIEKHKCSICGKPVLDCEHISGELYDDVECQRISGICNICGLKDCNSHILSKKYDKVRAKQIVCDLKLITFDMVQSPEMRYARVKKIIYSEDEIKEYIPDDELELFEYGKTRLFCNHCLLCNGYNPKLFDDIWRKD